MGCLIHYAVRDGMLQAVVRGKTLGRGADGVARWVANDIAEQADRATCKRVLIDVRGVADRLGSLGALAGVVPATSGGPGRVAGYRVAVVDALQNDAYYALHEMAASARGCVLRCFSTVADAARWLRGTPG
jgi:hypothetical protein